MVRRCLPIILVLAPGCALPSRISPLDSVRADLPRIEAQRLSRPAVLAGSTVRVPSDGSLRLHGTSDQAAVTDAARAYNLDDVAAETQPSDVHSARRAPLSSFWETLKRDVQDFPEDIWHDTRKVYGSPTNLLILGLSYGGALAVQESGPDDTVEHSYETHRTFEKDWRDTFNVLGNPGTHFGLAGLWYLVGQQCQNEKTYNVGRKLFSAFIITDLSVLIGQTATWDDAPNGEWGSFPSGHVASTFALASVMHEEYGPLVGVPLYGLGALVGIARLEDHEHYLSDVLFGGVLGLVVGHTVAADKPLELFGGTIIPYADPYTASTGVAWWKKID
ncbi:MAG TPA: phosphatase PAP2 family protein [Phycisphaerae bacterium]|jgi:hypothetical protein